jgi:large conductance mechanosensitive channel
MSGFKNFILKGNVIELAVAVVIATSFGAVIKATVALLLGLVGKLGDQPDFSDWKPYGLLFGVWVTAVISFLILAAVVYFVVVLPYTRAKERFFPSEAPGTPADVQLLEEIRDLLAAQQGRPTATDL